MAFAEDSSLFTSNAERRPTSTLYSIWPLLGVMRLFLLLLFPVMKCSHLKKKIFHRRKDNGDSLVNASIQGCGYQFLINGILGQAALTNKVSPHRVRCRFFLESVWPTGSSGPLRYCQRTSYRDFLCSSHFDQGFIQ